MAAKSKDIKLDENITAEELYACLAPKMCLVCSDQALSCNFGAVTCESCKAFFRRNAEKLGEMKSKCNGSCEITVETRSSCKKCRLDKCFAKGMKKELILNPEQKMKRKRKIELNKLKKSLMESNLESIPPELLLSNGSVILPKKKGALPLSLTNKNTTVCAPKVKKDVSMSSPSDENTYDVNIKEEVLSPYSAGCSYSSKSPEDYLSDETLSPSSASTSSTIGSNKELPYDAMALYGNPKIDEFLKKVLMLQSTISNTTSTNPSTCEDSKQEKSDTDESATHKGDYRDIFPMQESAESSVASSNPMSNETVSSSSSGVFGMSSESVLSPQSVLGSLSPDICNTDRCSYNSANSQSPRDYIEEDTSETREDMDACSLPQGALEEDFQSAFKCFLFSESISKDSLTQLPEEMQVIVKDAIAAFSQYFDNPVRKPLADNFPTYTSWVNQIDLSIEILVSMSKHLKSFSSFSQDDQILLLKGSFLENICAMSMRAYDEKNRRFVLPKCNLPSGFTNHNASTSFAFLLQTGNGKILYKSYNEFFQSFVSASKGDLCFLMCCILILLHTPHDKIQYADFQKIYNWQQKYIELMKMLIAIKYPNNEVTFDGMMHAMEILKKCASHFQIVLLQSNIDELLPLLAEVFDVNNL